MTYHIGTRGKGKPLRGGWREPWLDYFGDPTASTIKFGMQEFGENLTLRRSRCDLGHLYSVEVVACPVCALAREERRVAADISGAVARVLAATPMFSGRCRQCSGKVALRVKGTHGRQRLFCGEKCRHAYGNERRG